MRPADDLASELRRDGARPFLTWYDDADGSRVELSVATTANWVAKLANWLVDEADVDPDATVALGAAGHWLAPLCALAAWSVGAQLAPPGTDGDVRVPEGDPAELQRNVLSQPDAVLAPSSSEVDGPVVELPQGARVLSTIPVDTAAGVDVLLAALRAGGSLVLVANPALGKLADRAATERVTHVAGVEVPELPRVA
jgi:acyl-coenzyme A synthetase/AMP-(fatty) acid ligase